jgi:hypothetical protein
VLIIIIPEATNAQKATVARPGVKRTHPASLSRPVQSVAMGHAALDVAIANFPASASRCAIALVIRESRPEIRA